MGFLNYLVRRLALVVPTLFGVSLICFFLTYMLPGNPAMVKAGPFATAQHLAEMEVAVMADFHCIDRLGQKLAQAANFALDSQTFEREGFAIGLTSRRQGCVR